MSIHSVTNLLCLKKSTAFEIQTFMVKIAILAIFESEFLLLIDSRCQNDKWFSIDHNDGVILQEIGFKLSTR